MESWNVITCKDPEADYVLLNESRTLVRMSKRVKIDINELMSEMEEAGVPIAYTAGLKKIRFTHLPELYGDYREGIIRLSCNRVFREIHARTFVHELAHHIDQEENNSSREDIVEEYRTRSRYMADRYARKNVEEYMAVGFEVYYFGSKPRRAKMRKHNPRLYKLVAYMHRKYKSR